MEAVEVNMFGGDLTLAQIDHLRTLEREGHCSGEFVVLSEVRTLAVLALLDQYLYHAEWRLSGLCQTTSSTQWPNFVLAFLRSFAFS